MGTLADHFDDPDDFDNLLGRAEAFCADIRDLYEQCGERMYLTDKQFRALELIAGEGGGQ